MIYSLYLLSISEKRTSASDPTLYFCLVNFYFSQGFKFLSLDFLSPKMRDFIMVNNKPTFTKRRRYDRHFRLMMDNLEKHITCIEKVDGYPRYNEAACLRQIRQSSTDTQVNNKNIDKVV